MTDATVRLWGRRVGGISWDSSRAIGVFQYDPDFCSSGIQVAPLTMPLDEDPYDFLALNRETFRGLPGLLADALLKFASTSGVSRYEARRVMERVFSAVGRWREFAKEAGVSERDARRIENAHPTHLDRARV